MSVDADELNLDSLRSGRERIPSGLEDFVLPFNWDVTRLWELDCDARRRPRRDLDYLLQLPLWSSRPNAGMLYDLSAMTVIGDPHIAPHQLQRIMNADASFPLEFLEYCGRCWILDGVHRLARLYMTGTEEVDVRIHEESIIPHIRVV